MIDAISVALQGMANDIDRLQVISHNLANAATPGFKKQVVAGTAFRDWIPVASGLRSNSGSLPVDVPTLIHTVDHAAGKVIPTKNPLDIALEGEGFFELKAPEGVFYCRQGSFTLDNAGRVVAPNGFAVMGTGGEIHLTDPTPSIDQDGNVFEAGKVIDRIKVVKFPEGTDIKPIGNGMFAVAPETAIDVSAAGSRIRQGFLETSNVDSMTEMVKLIETMRHFEAGQKVVQGYGEAMDRAIRSLGEF